MALSPSPTLEYVYTTGEWLESTPQSIYGHMRISRISGVDEPGGEEPDIHFFPPTPTKVLPKLSQTIPFKIRGCLRFVFEIERGMF